MGGRHAREGGFRWQKVKERWSRPHLGAVGEIVLQVHLPHVLCLGCTFLIMKVHLPHAPNRTRAKVAKVSSPMTSRCKSTLWARPLCSCEVGEKEEIPASSATVTQGRQKMGQEVDKLIPSRELRRGRRGCNKAAQTRVSKSTSRRIVRKAAQSSGWCKTRTEWWFRREVGR